MQAYPPECVTDTAIAGHEWAPTPILRWLIEDAWRIEDISELLGAVCERLQSEGVPIRRAFIIVPTLHPLYLGKGYRWVHGEDEIRIGVGQHGAAQSEVFRRSPLRVILEDREPVFRRRLDPANHAPDVWPLLDELVSEGMTDYVAFLLEFTGDRRSVMTFASDEPEGFSSADLRQFCDMRPLLARLLERETLRTTAANVMDTYVGHRAGERILRGDITRGDAIRQRAVLMATDLRGFTALSESQPTDRVVEALDSYFETMARSIAGNGGEILKFIGDGLLAIFPVDIEDQARQVCRAALTAAVNADLDMKVVNEARRAVDQPELDYGCALHFGTVTYGNVGAENRLDFTAIGPAVNLVARLEQLHRRTGIRPLLSEAFVTAGDLGAEPVGRYQLKGIAGRQTFFRRGPEPLGREVEEAVEA